MRQKEHHHFISRLTFPLPDCHVVVVILFGRHANGNKGKTSVLLAKRTIMGVEWVE